MKGTPLHERKIGALKELLPVLERVASAGRSLLINEQIGVNIIVRATEEPMRWIAANAGQEGSIVVQRVTEMKDEEGFNAQSDQCENLVRAGVIDPTKVVRSAIQNAASIASLMLTTEAVISQIPEQQNAAI